MKWYKKSAEAGLPLAMSNIAYFYAQGRGGVKQDIAEARKWWQKAADLGEAKAMMPLAEACLNGREVGPIQTPPFDGIKRQQSRPILRACDAMR